MSEPSKGALAVALQMQERAEKQGESFPSHGSDLEKRVWYLLSLEEERQWLALAIDALCAERVAKVTSERDRLKEALTWIPVTERYPENGQRVLFVVDKNDGDYYGGSIMAGRYRCVQYGKRECIHEFSFPGRGTRASHWMPLPDFQYRRAVVGEEVEG